MELAVGVLVDLGLLHPGVPGVGSVRVYRVSAPASVSRMP